MPFRFVMMAPYSQEWEPPAIPARFTAVVRMCAGEIDGVGMGSPGYDELEAEAYGDLKLIDQAVETAIAGKGAYEFEPIVTTLAMMFGTGASEIKPLSAIIGMNATAAHEKILPELLADLS